MLRKVGHIQGLMKALGSDVATGIVGDVKDLDRRKKWFGENRKPIPEPKSIKEAFLEQIDDAVIKILLVAACITIVVGVCNRDTWEEGLLYGWIEGVSIIVAVAFIVLITTLNNSQ